MSEENKANSSGKKVIIALTGRIDSAVAAFLLKKQGFDVIGLSMVNVTSDIVNDPKYLPKCHIVNLERVRQFCDKIKIPFFATDAKPIFEAEVLNTLVTNQLIARANSTCFNCTRIRFQILYEKMQQMGADFIATGHYCKVYKNLSSNEYFIHSNNDPASDQSYLLAGLERTYLQHLVLPLGELRKEEVKKIATNFGLDADPSIEQEGFCFRNKKSNEKILRNAVPKNFIKEGQIVNVEQSSVVGDHDGMIFHFVTEKEFPVRGTTNLEKGLEITGYNFLTGTIEVASKAKLTFGGTQVINLKLSNALDRKKPIHCFIKFKYENKFTKAALFFKNNSTAYLELEQDIYPLIPGEMMSIYDSNGRNAKIIGLAEIGQRGKFKPIDRVKVYRPKVEDDAKSKTDNMDLFFKF